MDMFITLLSMGSKKYKQLVKERKENYQYLSTKLSEVAAKHGERVLSTGHNGISMGKIWGMCSNYCIHLNINK